MKKTHKNSIIGGIVGILCPVIFIGLTLIHVITPTKWPKIVNDTLNFISIPAFGLAIILGCDGERGMLTLLFCILLYYALIGAIIGFILTKINAKAKHNNTDILDSENSSPEI